MTELAVLQAVRLEGRVNVADLATTIGEDPSAARRLLPHGVVRMARGTDRASRTHSRGWGEIRSRWI